MAAMPIRPRYHHGDLKAALLAAAREILTEQGLGALTLRAVAARADVSHAAPQHHFPTMCHLLTALAVEGFVEFAQTLIAFRDRAPPNPRARLGALGDGYVHFVEARPNWFRLIFSLAGHELNWEDEALLRAGEAARAVLVDVAGEIAAARGEAGRAGAERIALMVWASVHGYTHLLLAGRLSQGAPPPPRPAIEDILLESFRAPETAYR